tara:strand:- start:2137 stop:3306 length:1170 start_codon:yes stop_codon:yes gene_type:complete
VNNLNKILLLFYIFLASSYGIFIFTSSEGLDDNFFELILPKKTTDFEIIRFVDVPHNQIFDVMANIENFPNVIPKNIINVNITSNTKGVIIAEEEFSEAGIKTKLIVKHTITPYNEHLIEIIEGDAKGTTITQSFESVGTQTKLSTNVHLNLNGVTSIIAFLPESNLKHAVNTIISHFVKYSEYDVYEKIVISIYNEILHRPADMESLLHYSKLLQNEKITEQELREILVNSEENTSLKMKSIDELNSETIKIISGLYKTFLIRDPDPEGLQHYGNLFENGTTYDELRTIFLDSEEAESISFTHPVRRNISIIYGLIYDDHPNKFELDYYHKMIDDGKILYPSWITILLMYDQDIGFSDDAIGNAFKYLNDKGIIIISKNCFYETKEMC